jgi:hypothetical protein
MRLNARPSPALITTIKELTREHGYEAITRALARVVTQSMKENQGHPFIPLRKKQHHVIYRCADNLYKARRKYEQGKYS